MGELGYGFLIQTEMRVDVIATSFAFNISIFCFMFYACQFAVGYRLL
jgi:hypothetical protein